jgi:hypothetical protein
MSNFNNKWNQAQDGYYPCTASSDESSPVRILVWVGGRNPDDSIKCDLELQDLKSEDVFFYILAENYYIVEEKILYTVESLNKALGIRNKNSFSITEILYAIPHYGKVHNTHPLPTFHSWELKHNPNNPMPQEILRTEYMVDPSLLKGNQQTITVTVQIHRP